MTLYFRFSEENFNNIHKQFSHSLLPIKFFNKFKLSIFYYLSRGCIVIKLKQKKCRKQKFYDLFL